MAHRDQGFDAAWQSVPTASGVRRARFIDDNVADHREKGNLMTTEFALLFAIGFVAQLVDGTLGMAYGVLSNAAMLTMGLPPAHASALVHTAEVFTPVLRRPRISITATWIGGWWRAWA